MNPITWEVAFNEIIAECVRAERKHEAENAGHQLSGWIGVISKQIGDLAKATASRDRPAIRKELTQVGAAVVLAITALDKEE